MAKKGVKSIGLAPGSKYYPKKGNANTIVVPAGITTTFMVKEWFPATSAKEKTGEVFWIRQTENRQVDLFKDKRPFNNYGLVIAKKFAGLTKYYLEASLTGYIDLSGQTGIYVRGFADFRVVSSYWREDRAGNNEQIHKGKPTIYNRNLHLHLELEGLNGYTCIVEVYNCEYNLFGDNNQKISKTYTQTVVNGELDVKIPAADTLAWRSEIGAEKPIEQFYIKLRVRGLNGYVIDTTPKKDSKHAIHLYIKNEIGVFIAPIVTSNKVVTVGNEPKKAQRNDLCKFTGINVHDRNAVTVLFDESKAGSYGIAERTFKLGFDVFYDTDAYEVPNDSKPILNNIAKFLKNNVHLKASVESYADIRQTDDYNYRLTNNRANRLLSFFYTNGVKNELTATSYGESRAFQFKLSDNLDRPIHKVNRKTAVSFRLNSLKRLFYNTIMPNVDTPTGLSFFVKNYETKGCMVGGSLRHDKSKVKYLELVNFNGTREVTKDIPLSGEKFDVQVFSSQGGMFPTPLSLTPNRYELRVNCCAYFPDSSKSTIVVNAFTDAVWILHATYDYPGEYPLVCRGISVSTPIVRGIAGIRARVQYYVDKYLSVLKYFPMTAIYPELVNLALDFFESEAEMYGIGYGKRWNMVGSSFQKSESYAENNKDLIEKGILTLTILVMIVEIIIAILTGGSSAATKLPKLKKAAKLLKKIDSAASKVTDLGFDFIFPKVAFTYGAYLEKVKGIVHFVTQYNINADPIIGIKFDKTLSLKDILTNALIQSDSELSETMEKEKIDKEDPLRGNLEKQARNAGRKAVGGEIGKGFQTLLDRAGHDAMIRILVSGEIKQEYKLKVSAPVNVEQYDGKVEVVNQLVSGFNNSAGKSIGQSSLKLEAELKIKTRVHVIGILPIDPFSAQGYLGRFASRIDVAFTASLQSHFNHTRTWSAGDYSGLYYQDTIYFSGVKGKVRLSATKNSDRDKDWDSPNNLIDTEFNLFGEHRFNMPKVQFL